MGMLGPALPSLRAQVGASVSAISFVFVAQSAGYLVGAVTGGRLLDRGHGHRLLAAALVLMALGLVLVAQAGTLGLMCGAFVLLGLAIGFVEVGTNTLLVWARAPTSAAMINALHFVFGVGALLAPLLVNRSLSARGNARLAYVVTALASVLAAAIVSCTRHRARSMSPSTRGEVASNRLLVAVSLFFALYVGIEVGFAGWIATYAQSVPPPRLGLRYGGRVDGGVLGCVHVRPARRGRHRVARTTGRPAAGFLHADRACRGRARRGPGERCRGVGRDDRVRARAGSAVRVDDRLRERAPPAHRLGDVVVPCGRRDRRAHRAVAHRPASPVGPGPVGIRIGGVHSRGSPAPPARPRPAPG